MKKTLPLFFYPSTWVWVDDYKTLLKAMTRVFDKTNQILAFQSAKECLTYFKEYCPPLTEHHFLTDLNNKIKKTCNYIDGKLSGQVKEFIIGKHHEDLITSTYVNGVLHGLHTIETSIKGEIDHYFIYNKYENGVLIETSEE